MPSVTRGVELNLPKAEPLADLYGVTDDLTRLSGFALLFGLSRSVTRWFV